MDRGKTMNMPRIVAEIRYIYPSAGQKDMGWYQSSGSGRVNGGLDMESQKRKKWPSWLLQAALACIAVIGTTGCNPVTEPSPSDRLEPKGTWVVYQELGSIKLGPTVIVPTSDLYYLVIDSNTVTTYLNYNADKAEDSTTLAPKVVCFRTTYSRIGNDLTLSKSYYFGKLRITGTDLLGISQSDEIVFWHRRFQSSLPSAGMAWPPTQDTIDYANWTWTGTCYE
jgi:hypothetical protein